MKRINYDILQKGDVILTTSDHLTSKAIRLGTKSDISHAMICVAYTSVMDSTGEGVHARNIQKMFYPDECAIHAYRLKTPAPEQVIDSVISYVRSETGTPYATLDAVRSVTQAKRTGNRKQFCSRLVARAYASVGIMLCDDPDYCTPEDLKSSPALVEIAESYVMVSAEEAEFLEKSDKTNGMRDITNDLLDSVKNLDRDILSLSDITKFAVDKPELDSSLAEALRTSGYLDHWKEQLEIFPWRYDFEKMSAYEKEVGTQPIAHYCKITINDEKNETFKHWKECLDIYEHMCQRFERETLHLLRDLYKNLVSSHACRVEVATKWLEERIRPV